MADVTVEQLNKILTNTDDKIDDTYTRLASLYTKQSAQLSVNLQKLTNGLDRATNEEKKAEEKNTKSVLSPLDTIATHLHYIRKILAEQFKKTSLGTADKDVGVIKRNGTPFQTSKDSTAPLARTTGKFGMWPYIMGGIIGVAIIDEIRKQLKLGWTGMANIVLKPLGAFGKITTSIASAGGKLLTFINKFMKRFPRLFAIPLKIIRGISSALKGLPTILANIRAGFQLYIAEPLARWGSKIGPLLAKFFPITAKIFGVLKKAAIPLTIVMEAFDTLKMIFGGEGGFLKNAQEMSDTINSKGTFGRAVHGLVHSVTTITTFIVDLGKTMGAWWDASKIIFDEIAESFHKLVHGMKISFFEMWNSLAEKLSWLSLNKAPIEEEEKDYQWNRIKRAIKQQGMPEAEFDKIVKTESESRSNVNRLAPRANEDLVEFRERALKHGREKAMLLEKKILEKSTVPKQLSPENLKMLMGVDKEEKQPTQHNNTSLQIFNQWNTPRPSSNFNNNPYDSLLELAPNR